MDGTLPMKTLKLLTMKINSVIIKLTGKQEEIYYD